MSNDSVFKIGRRSFIRGVGGAALAIPFLPSLVEREARGKGVTVPPRYFYVGTDHGGAWDQNYYPVNQKFTNTMAVPNVSGHMVSSGSIAATTSGANTVVSPILTAASSSFASLVPKMNCLQGLDVPWYLAHNTGLLGNYGRNDSSGSGPADGYTVAQQGDRPTIDQIMGSSSSFYTSGILANTKSRVMVISGQEHTHSYQSATPDSGTAAVNPVDNTDSSLALFHSIFGTGSSGTMQKQRKSAVDLVLASYNSLMQGNSQISAADKVRLSQHIASLSSIEGSLSATLACATTPPAPADNTNYGFYNSTPNYPLYGSLFMDVVAAAFACNATRVSSFMMGDTSLFSPSYVASGDTDFHHHVAHEWFQDQAQAYLVESYQQFFEKVFVYLAAKLNGMQDADGKTVLDNSLLVWGQECCMETHEQYGIQTTTFGGAGGAMNTGLYCDYRFQRTSTARQPGSGQGAGVSAKIANYTTWPGLLWSQWLATQLSVMGIQPSEWELWKDSSGATIKGVGTPYCSNRYTGMNFPLHYVPNSSNWQPGLVPMSASPYWSNASQPLPFLTKT